MVRFARLLWSIAFAVAMPACGGQGGAFGPADSYTLFTPAPDSASPGRGPVVRRLDEGDALVQPLAKLLADGFAAEMVRTVYLVKQLLRDGQPGGHAFPPAGRALAAQGLPVIVGLDRDPY